MANKFLIVDDSSTTRAVIKRTINMAQIPTENIYEAGNGAEALALLEQFKVDLVLADLNMPVMGGVEMTQKMRKNPAFKDIPVIVVSSESMEKKIALLRAQGVKGYIKKPFTPEQIRDVVLEVIGGAVHA
jgi:two-component system chemotaxis response regulator CheY